MGWVRDGQHGVMQDSLLFRQRHNGAGSDAVLLTDFILVLAGIQRPLPGIRPNVDWLLHAVPCWAMCRRGWKFLGHLPLNDTFRLDKVAFTDPPLTPT